MNVTTTSVAPLSGGRLAEERPARTLQPHEAFQGPQGHGPLLNDHISFLNTLAALTAIPAQGALALPRSAAYCHELPNPHKAHALHRDGRLHLSSPLPLAKPGRDARPPSRAKGWPTPVTTGQARIVRAAFEAASSRRERPPGPHDECNLYGVVRRQETQRRGRRRGGLNWR